jgi:MFS family permease
MLRNALIAGIAALGIAALPAHAETQRLPDEVVGVEAHRNTGGIIVGDAVGGALVGGLVGGGVAAYRNYVNNDGWGNWQRDVLVGAGIGLGIGLIVGVADVASTPSGPTYVGAAVDHPDRGFDAPMAARGFKF